MSKIQVAESLKGVRRMKVNVLMGMIVGSAIGAAATMIALPYIQPQMKRMIRTGRRAINTHMDKMTEPGG